MGDSVKLQPLFLLSDEPISVSGDDGLGMNQTARVIAEAALGAATPFTVGIFGAWGHGKTSLLNAARTLLEPVKPDGTIMRPHPHVVTVQFNAWRYEKEPHPIVPLVASIARAVEQRIKDDTTFEKAVGEKGKAIARALCDGAMAVASTLRLDAKGRLGAPTVAQIEGGIGIDVGAAQKSHAERVAKREAASHPRVQSWIDQSLYLSAFDDLARLHAAAKANGGANQTSQAPVIVVFIDDLDRCRPEAAVEILEGIKLVLAQPGFVFVLALYREVIERYLEVQCEDRYGVERKDIGAGYIDKIVQLPIWLPSHESGFEGYIRHLIDTKLSDGLLPHKLDAKQPGVIATSALLDAVRQSIPLLSRLSVHSPRKLVRKINELLIDDRLLPDSAHETIGCKPEDRRAILFPLCLIQRALWELPLSQQIKPLLENDNLCAALAVYRADLADTTDADGNFAPMLFRDALKAKAQESVPREGKVEAGDTKKDLTLGETVLSRLDSTTARRWLKATDCLSQNDYRANLLNTTAGRAWLTNHAARRLVAKAIMTQAVPLAVEGPVSVGMKGSLASADALPTPIKPATFSMTEELLQQTAMVYRAIRHRLGVKANALLGLAEVASVTELDLSGEPIGDAGVAWLADVTTGLRSLTELYLDGTSITDAGVMAIAAPNSGLRALTTLDLRDTKITDLGAAALAGRYSGLQSLTTLDLGGTQITDVGAAAMAAQGSGLESLTSLSLRCTEITDAGAVALASEASGLPALRWLDLDVTKVTDAGVAAIKDRYPGIDVIY